MNLIKKTISITIILAMLFSMCVATTAFADNVYSVYTDLNGKIELEDETVKIENGTTFKVYVYANVGAASKDKVTAFHLLGSVSDNLEIVDSGFAADEALLAIENNGAAGDIPSEYQSFNKMLHNSKTTGKTIDFTAVVFPNNEGNAIASEDGFAKLIWIELKAIGTGAYTITLDDSYVRTAFDDIATDKFCMTGVTFSKRAALEPGDDGTTVPSGTVTGGGGYVSGKKDGKINEVDVDKIANATVTIDQENKTITVEVPEGTDLSNLSFTFDYEGKEISVKDGEIVDATNPVEIKVTGTNGKDTTYTLTASHKAAGSVDTEESIFADVELERWSYNMIKEMYDDGVVDGYGADENGKIIIKPTGLITRQEAAKLSVGAYGLDVTPYSETVFADNRTIADWAVAYVAAGAAHPNKMVRGYPEDNTFRPYNNITREELVTLIINTFGFGVDENPAISFADADEITWSAGYVSKAVSLGIVVGYEDSTFRPGQYVTREEALTMFDRALVIYKSLTQE